MTGILSSFCKENTALLYYEKIYILKPKKRDPWHMEGVQRWAAQGSQGVSSLGWGIL